MGLPLSGKLPPVKINSDRSIKIIEPEDAEAPSGPMKLSASGVNVNAVSIQRPSKTTKSGENAKRSSSNGLATGSVNGSWTNPGNLQVDPYGCELFNPSYKNVTVNIDNQKNLYTINFDLDIECPWGVNGGTNTDITSGSDSAITKDNYSTIVQDLTPVKKEKCWVPPFSSFWSKAATERHERFHSTDDKAWSEGDGKNQLRTFIEAQSIPVTDLQSEIIGVMDSAMNNMRNDNMIFYMGGASSYYSYTGEERAYADGKEPLEKLAEAVKQQGEKLAQASSPVTTAPPPQSEP